MKGLSRRKIGGLVVIILIASLVLSRYVKRYTWQASAVSVSLGFFKEDSDFSRSSSLPKVIQTLSHVLSKHSDATNVSIEWEINPGGNGQPSANVVTYDYQSHELQFCPEAIGPTYKFTNVTANKLHLMARQQATDFNGLRKLGCEEYYYDTDLMPWQQTVTRIQ